MAFWNPKDFEAIWIESKALVAESGHMYTVLVRVSIAVMRHCDQKQLGEERLYAMSNEGS